MREYAILGCVFGVVACHGGGGDAKRDSLARDTMTVAGPPAVTVAPSPVSESIASRSRTTSKAGATAPDARKSPSSGSNTKPSGSTTGGTKTAGTKTVGPTLVTPPVTALTDTVRGIVSVVGTERERRVTIARPGGGKRVEITGPIAPLIGHVAGADVWVAGTPSGTSLEATRFIVRTVDGAPALDGTLKTEGAALYLVTTDGTRTRIVAPPPPLLGHDGARVWITGDPSRGVASFGFIDPPG
jgi:hypothetical protein